MRVALPRSPTFVAFKILSAALLDTQAQCKQWSAHCRTAAADVAAARAAERKATLGERIRAVPCRPPPALGGAVARQLVHWQWLQLRHTGLTLLSHCGCGEDVLVATLVAANEVRGDSCRTEGGRRPDGSKGGGEGAVGCNPTRARACNHTRARSRSRERHSASQDWQRPTHHRTAHGAP